MIPFLRAGRKRVQHSNYSSGVSNFRKILTMENTETRIRGTPKSARRKPLGISLACVHLPYTDIFGWAIIG